MKGEDNIAVDQSMLHRSFQCIYKSCAVSSSILISFMWVSLSFVEEDIKHDVNWFLMLSNGFLVDYDFYFYFKLFSLSLTTLHLVCVAVNGIFGLFCKDQYFVLYEILNFFVFIINLVLMYLLQTTGYKIWQLFLLASPLVAVKLANTSIYTVFILVIALLLVSLYRRTLWVKRSTNHQQLFFTFMLHIFLVTLTISVQGLTIVACKACLTATLPVKPVLTAHRGCPAQHPESSIEAFKTSSRIEAVTALESDVRISMDKELFLLHDSFLVRTTSIRETCPAYDPYTVATKFSYRSGDCPLQSLYLKGATPGVGIPTFDDLLKIAKDTQKNVIFDLQVPHPGHECANSYVELTLQAILKSEINLNKVWWLHPINRSLVHSKYPELTQIAKSQFTDLEQFKKLNIKIANEEWSTPVHIIRGLKDLGVSINMYTISTTPLFEYAWCLGVTSVTTNECDYFSKWPLENFLHQYCFSNWSIVYGLFALVNTSFLCYTSIHWYTGRNKFKNSP